MGNIILKKIYELRLVIIKGMYHSGCSDEEDRKFVSEYIPAIYFNDLTAKYWAFDFRLPGGRWIENITLQQNNGIIKLIALCAV